MAGKNGGLLFLVVILVVLCLGLGGGGYYLLQEEKTKSQLLEEELDQVTDLLLDNARTGRIGDGKLFVLPLEDVIRVRTGERGDSAL